MHLDTHRSTWSSEPRAREAHQVQRQRIFAAVAVVCAEEGLAALSMTRVAERAHVYPFSVRRAFDDVQGCLLAAFDDTVAQARRRAVGAARGVHGWPAPLAYGLQALVDAVDQDPARALLVLTWVPASGPEGQRRLVALEDELAALDARVRDAAGLNRLSPLAARVAAAGTLALLRARAQDPDPQPAPELVKVLTDELTVAVVEPNGRRGPATGPAARRSRELPTVASAWPEMRLTFRAVRVMRNLAVSPGLSGRKVANAVGSSDASEVSRLLRRLEQHGLTVKELRGRAHAWRLTSRGEELLRAIGPPGA